MNDLLAELRRAREGRRPPPVSEQVEAKIEPTPKRAKVAAPLPSNVEVIDCLSSDDEGAAAHPSDEQLARRLQDEENEAASRSRIFAAGPSNTNSAASVGAANPLGLDLSRVEILRRADPTPVILFRAVGGGLERLAASFATFDIAKEDRSNRKCGAAENTGTHGKNCDNTFHPLAETNNQFDPKSKRITHAQSAEWVRGVVQPCFAAAAAALRSGGGGGGGGGSAGARQLTEAHDVAAFAPAEIRVLQYDAPVRADKKEGKQFHRHLDHGMYGWVVLASLHADCDFYVRLGPRPAAPTCTCGLPCKLATVTKEGDNFGRYYYTCRGQYNACKAFDWGKPGDEVPSAERVLKLSHGDVLIFDASRQSDVEHGVDAVYKNRADPKRNYRVSVQWRVTNPAVAHRTTLAWMAKNLADFDDADVLAAFDVLGSARPQSVSGASRVAAVQRLIDVAGDAAQQATALNALVRRVCEAPGNGNRFLSKRLVGGGRVHIESSWHIDPDIREACFRDTVRVPATPGAGGPLRAAVRLPPLSRLGMTALT